MCSILGLSYRFFSYALFLWIILSWIQVSREHPIGKIKILLDSFFDQLLAPIRNMVPTLRIGMAGLDLSPIVLILGLNYLVLPFLSRLFC
tara:strand:- start:158 stop:427 length:270 start_codon:yes stop_codon:yes gene_type:complete